MLRLGDKDGEGGASRCVVVTLLEGGGCGAVVVVVMVMGGGCGIRI